MPYSIQQLPSINRRHLQNVTHIAIVRHPYIAEGEKSPGSQAIKDSMVLSVKFLDLLPHDLRPRDGLILMSPSTRVRTSGKGFAGSLGFSVTEMSQLQQDGNGQIQLSETIAEAIVNQIEPSHKVLIILGHGPHTAYLARKLLPGCGILKMTKMTEGYLFNLTDGTYQLVKIEEESGEEGS